MKDIEINDLRNRYTLTKGQTQKMVTTHLATVNTDFPKHPSFGQPGTAVVGWISILSLLIFGAVGLLMGVP